MRTRGLSATVERLKARPRLALAVAINRRQREDGIRLLAAAVTFYLFLSVLPALLLILSAAGYVLSRQGLGDAQDLVERLAADLPGLGPIVKQNLQMLSDSWTGLGVVALVGVLWAGTGGVAAVRDAMARIFRTTPGGNAASQRGQSLLIILGFGPLLLASIAVTAWATTLGGEWAVPARWVITGLAIAFALAFNFLIFIALYRMFVPGSGAVAHNHWPGAMLAGTSFTMLTLLGSTYTQRILAKATAVWGAFAGTIGALIILTLAVKFFLYGAELTAFRLERRRGD